MANTNAVSPPMQPQMTVQQANNAAQRLVVQNAVEMTQNIFSGSVFPTSQPVLNIIPRNVGVVKKFVIRVVATLQNTGAGPAILSQFGLANLISNVTFYDLQNNLRVNTTGVHLTALSGVKRRRPFAGCADFNQTAQIQVVSGGPLHTSQSQMFNVPPATRLVYVADDTIAAGQSVTCEAWFEVPLAYSDDDLRGAVFANVVNTTMNLQITFNANKSFNGTVAGADDAYCVYSGQTGVFSTASVDVYQVYLDQLPTAKDGTFILPQISLATVYELKNSTFTGMTQNQEFPVPFTNFRDFFSTFAIYNADGTTAGRIQGGNINYWSLTTANFTNVWKYTPDFNNLLTREVLSADMPQGMYYFSFRKHPIWTTQFGNQQINLSPANAGPSSYLQIFWEDMALQNTLVGSASLPAGG